MRLFVAIELPDDVRRLIAAEQRRLAGLLDARSETLRLVPVEQLHLTLVFIGEVPDARVGELTAAMSGELRQPAFTLSFAGAGVFPPRGAPRVLWIGVEQGRDAAIALQGEVAARLAPCGVPPESRPFQPHLTVGRWRDRRQKRSGARSQPDVGGRLVAAMEVERITLFQSRVSSSGSIHTPLAHAQLACPSSLSSRRI
jgi:2'-5' RNA ligase